MADLFDIANLITTVGVDGVKIKHEPGLPEKSSNEILTELFSTFDTPDDDVASSLNSDQQVPNGDKTAEPDKLQTKRKKIKKKHKHKEKKHKKKSRHNSSDSNSNTEGAKKKKKHKKKSKRRRESVSSRTSDSGHTKAKVAKLDDDNSGSAKHDDAKSLVDASEKISVNDESKPDDQSYMGKESDIIDKVIGDSGSPRLPPISRKADDEFDEPVIPKLIEKPKQPSQGKIMIKDLKNSTVYSETVKAIENKRKAKAARMEDGELFDSSSTTHNDNRTPTLSPTPPRDRSLSFSPTRDGTGSKMFSPTRGPIASKSDLRLVLKERERKRSTRDKDSHLQDRRSRSRTRYSSRRSRSGGREKQRSRSRERRERDRSSERRDSGRSRERYRYRSRSENKDKHARGRSASRERKERIEINKKKLLEIARRNVIKQGTLSVAQQDKAIAAIQSGGKTVDELTDFCKSLSKSEALGELSSISPEDEESESEKGFHHPFLLKERPSSIIMNIRDAKQLPTKTFQEKTAETSNQLRLQFPVSSGQHHRRTKNEWIPVTPKKSEPKKMFVPASTNPPPAIMPPPPVQPVQPVQSVQPAQTVFPTTTETMDIGSIVSERLAAIRKLRENPNDVTALNAMHRAQNEMRTWAESKQVSMPGQFTGSTGVKVLTPAELSSGYQAWAHKAYSYIREKYNFGSLMQRLLFAWIN